MPAAEPHPNEQQRLKALRSLGILDTVHEGAYDDIAQLAAELCGTPIAAVSLVDEERQWFKANFGLNTRETPRSMAFCAHAIHNPDEPLIVSDARVDPRFVDNPLVLDDPHIRFYAGIPLKTSEEQMPVGTLCVISNEVMTIDDRQRRTLKMLASHVERLLHLREVSRQLAQRDLLLDASNDAIVTWTNEDGVLSWNTGAERLFGYNRSEVIGTNPCEVLQASDKMQDAATNLEVGADWTCENNVTTRSGETLTLSTRLQNVAINADLSINLAICRDITERRETQRRLERTQRALDTSPDAAIWLREETGEIIFVNEEACRQYGYSVDEFLKLRIADIDHTIREAGALERVRADSRQLKSMHFEATHVRKDGSKFPVEVASQLTEFDDEFFVSTHVRDITERKQVERQLRLAQHSLDKATDGIFWVNAENGNIIYANEAATRRLQYSREEMQSMKLSQIDSMVESPDEPSALWDDQTVQELAAFQTSHICKDGTKVPVEVATHRIEFDGATFHCGVARDITERLQTRQKLEALSAELQWIIDALPMAMIIADVTRRICRVNPAFERIFGYGPEEAIGKETKFLYANRDDFDTQGRQRFNPHAVEQLSPYEIEYRRKDGSSFTGETIGTRMKSTDGEVVGNLGLIQDVSERVATRERLAELSKDRHEMLKVLGEADGIWSWNLDSNAAEFAPGFRTMLGYAADDVQGFPDSIEAFKEHMHPDDSEEAWQLFEICLQENRPFTHEFRMRKADGSYIWVRERGSFICGQTGTPIRMAGITYDITDRKEAENERDQFFKTGIQLYGVADLESATWLKMSDNWVDVLGYANDELIGMNFLDAAHPEDRPQYIEHMRNLMAGNPVLAFLGRMQHRNGSYRWLEWYASPPKKGDSSVYFTANDVTEQDHDLLRKIDDAIPTALFVFDYTVERMIFVSRQYENLLGYSPEEMYAMPARAHLEMVHPNDITRAIAYRTEILGGNDNQTFDIELRTCTKDGDYRPIYCVSRIFKRAPDGSVQQIVGTLSLLDDITVLRRYARELESVNNELENFAYVASHDLKQPLRGIDNLARWIREDCGEALPEVANEHLVKLQGRVLRMERLLEDLLAYSRIGRSEAVFEDVDVRQLVLEIVELLGAPSEFRFQISGTWPLMNTERVPLEQVLRNLIGNAIKHHDRTDGIITIVACQNGEFQEFAVSDDGPGIAPEFHERIFRMFQTLRPRDEVEASGMGLALAKKHVETRGGQITIESGPEAGATFRFTWPEQRS